MMTVYERNTLTALLILDLEDSFARSRGRLGEHPRPLEPLRFFLVDRDIQGTVTKFNPPIELEVIRNASGYHLFFGREKVRGTQGGTSTRALDLPPGKYTLQITSPLYQTVKKKFDLPIGNANDPNIIKNSRLDLDASFAYPFPDVYSLGQQPTGNCSDGIFSSQHGTTLLRGALLDAGGKGWADATVRVPNRTNTYTTDSSGQWVLWFKEPQPTGPVDVMIKLPGGTEQPVDQVCVIQGHETSLHQTTLCGWVRRGSIPVAGAIVTVQDVSGQAITDKQGSWTFAFPFSQPAKKVTVNASVQGLPGQTRAVDLMPRATVVVDPFQF